MDSTLLGLMGIGIAIFFGLITIAGILLSSVHAFKKGIIERLSDMEKGITGQLSSMEKGITGQLFSMEKGITGHLSDIEKEFVGQLSSMEKGITGQLSPMRDMIVGIETSVQYIWEITRLRASKSMGTVYRELSNLGKIAISAEPHFEYTTYFLKATKPIFDANDVSKLARKTGLEKTEREIFGDQVPMIRSPLPNILTIRIPSTDPDVCTEYVSNLLKWLDSTYIKKKPKIEDFEDSIQI